MEGKWFIMIYNAFGNKAYPMTDENTDVILFPSKEAAVRAANLNAFARSCGCEVFELGTGETE